MKGRVTARQQRACGDGASSGARRRAEEEGWTSPVPESASRVRVIFLERPVMASASYVMTPLKNGVIGVIGVSVTVTASASYVMTPPKNGVIGVSVSVMTSSPDRNGNRRFTAVNGSGYFSCRTAKKTKVALRYQRCAIYLNANISRDQDSEEILKFDDEVSQA
ncbi:hypothetical protein GPALN_006957 [Globodera pallida]|nr:hypothetical protein GPALN_006957 [Globodera pallida]